MPSADRMAERLVRLYAGLVGFGISLALMVRARLGLASWDVLHQGIARQLGVQIGWVVIGMSAVVLNGVATGLYIGAGLGPGPRDGLMTGLAARGHSIRLVRTGIELTVLLTGWLLGGTVGLGTVVYALGIGPIAHVTIPRLAIPVSAVEPSTPG